MNFVQQHQPIMATNSSTPITECVGSIEDQNQGQQQQQSGTGEVETNEVKQIKKRKRVS